MMGNVVSIGLNGAASDGASGAARISDDGRYAAFVSEATNLVADDTNATSDIFVADLVSGTIERVSVAADGTEANGASGVVTETSSFTQVSEAPAISADGRYVAFGSAASNLVADDTNGQRDVFLTDRQTGTVTRISASALGEVEDGASSHPSMTPDGRYVVFQSTADNLVAGDGNGQPDIFVYDTSSSSLSRLAVDLTGLSLDHVDVTAGPPAISDDGRYVTFGFAAKDLATTNGAEVGVLVHDTVSGTTSFLGRETTYTADDLTTPASTQPTISGDGSTIAFVNGKIVDGDTYPELTVMDRATGEEITTVQHQWLRTYLDLKNSFVTPELTEDGSHLAYGHGLGLRSGGAQLELLDLTNGFAPRVSLADGSLISAASISKDGQDFTYSDQAFQFLQPPEIQEVLAGAAQALAAFTLAPAIEAQRYEANDLAGLDFGLAAGQDIKITYQSEVAQYQSVLGAYLVDAEGTIQATKVLFDRIEDSQAVAGLENVRPGGGPLSAGDSILLSDVFSAEELSDASQFGLFLIADGARLNDAGLFDANAGTLSFVESVISGPASVYSELPKLIFQAAGGGEQIEIAGNILHMTEPGSLTSPLDRLNPDGQDHVMAGTTEDGGLELRFEDMVAADASDFDFNDLTILVHSA